MAENHYREYVPGMQGTGSSAGAGSGAGPQDVPAGTRGRSDPYHPTPGRERDRDAEKQSGKDASPAKNSQR